MRTAEQQLLQRETGRHARRARCGSMSAVRPFRSIALGVLLILTVGCGRDDNSDSKPAETIEPVQVALAPKPTEAMVLDDGCVTPACHPGYLPNGHVHEPVQEGLCSSCHGPDTGEHMFPVLRSDNELCMTCHETGRDQSFVHQPILDPGCTHCHDPHVGRSATLITADSPDDQCTECHPKILKRYVHEPYDEAGCTTCHDPHASNHELFLSAGPGPEQCFECHNETADDLAAAEFDHQGVAKDCSACHSAHSADYPHLLRATTAELCFGCHTEMARQIADAPIGHDAVLKGDRCFQCHVPHGSGRPKLLRDDESKVCLECHSQTQHTADGRTVPSIAAEIDETMFRHGPVRFNDCSECHTIHGGTRLSLLTAAYVPDFYAPFDIANFALCFSCHNPEIVETPTSENVTDFRNGTTNLHYLHVHRDERGRTCRSCHAVHGSDQPKHIARQVPFENSDWMMDIRFEVREDGGWCAPGCHEPMTYSRSVSDTASPSGSRDNAPPAKTGGGS